MPEAVYRLRRTWSQLNRMDMTSITLFEGFQIPKIAKTPNLIDPSLLFASKFKMWQIQNDQERMDYFIRSVTSLKLIYMNLWSKHMDDRDDKGLILFMEDDIKFIRTKNETFHVINETMQFLEKHNEIKWDLLYLGYRDIEATEKYRISENPSISLWETSKVHSTTAFIVRQTRDSIEKLNACFLKQLSAADRAISYCLKSRLIVAYLIEPKLVQAIPGYSFMLNARQDYLEENYERHILGNHSRPATFDIK